MEQTQVEFKKDSQYKSEYKEKDKGYIDGYVFHNDIGPLAIVVSGNNLFLAKPNELKVLTP